MGAPFSSEVADAFASFRFFARLLACLHVRHFASRALQVNFTGTAVAFKFGTDFDRGKCLATGNSGNCRLNVVIFENKVK